jgi:large subunit ribosomal protein L9
MDVILKKDVEKLGEKDQLVSVKPGYGRNFLIPQGSAVLATPSLKKVHAENVKQRAHKEKAAIEEANKAVAKLADATIKLVAKVGESGKIFGSVTAVQVAEAFANAGYAVERKNIKIHNEPIKNVGKYKATLKLHREVSTEVNFEVVGE